MLAFCVQDSLTTDTVAQEIVVPEKVCPRVWPAESQYHGQPWTQNLSAPFHPTHGLLGQHLSVWSSHGRYFHQTKGWCWQRPLMFCTTEDLLTPSFVYPFIIPMLEKAGAVVWTPRERDMQRQMVHLAAPTEETEQNFIWQTEVPEVGDYAVYVRYPRLEDAVPDATYTIQHGGQLTRMAVNQRMGAETWTYLGTYHFSQTAKVTLSKTSNYAGRVAAGELRLGGGMGHILRSCPTDSAAVATSSGLPHYLEAARYYTEWAGLADSLYNTEAGLNDYNDDLRARSNLLNSLRSGGVPFSMSLAVHTDAGYRNDSLPYGSLAICTTQDSEGRHNYDDIISRQTSWDLCAYLLDNICRDLGKDLQWTQRGLRDRNYSESRAPHVPAAIIEMLSHQHFYDARLAHDPVFKFQMSRAIYKGVLRYLYHAHGMAKPVIQPLPVHNFSAVANAEEHQAILSWRATPDSLEPTATPTHYILYTRVNDGDFDNGIVVRDTMVCRPLMQGLRYTFRVAAANAGGESFPSNQLTVYLAPTTEHTAKDILLVDAFTRLSGPAYIDTPDSLGFLLGEDIGVPYGRTMEYCGAQTEFSRQRIGREGPGALGYSSEELTGVTIIGNTLDICAQRAATLLQKDSLVNISSISVGAITPQETPFYKRRAMQRPNCIYWLAGQQRRAPHNRADYPVWPEHARPFIEESLRYDCRLIVEGAYVTPDKLSDEEKEWWTSKVNAGVDR